MNHLIWFYTRKIYGLFFVLISIGADIECKQRQRNVSQAAEQGVAISEVLSPVNSVKRSDETLSKLSLDQIYALSQEKKSTQLPTRSKSIRTAEKTTDLYTQSQAHMSVPGIKQLIAAKYNIKPYEKFIKQILDREKEYDNYYVFYHGADNVWRLAQDVYTRLYMHFNNISPTMMQDFIFLRFIQGLDDVAIKDFLTNKLKESGLVNDHSWGNEILAVNLALFGNIGTAPECTWQYFIKSRGHMNPMRSTYESIMNTFGLSHKYIDELLKLVDLYETKEEMILQIFVPKDLVNSIGYLAWIRGNPADQPLMYTVLRSVQDQKFEKTASALDYYAKLFKQEQEKQPLFKDLITKVNAGEFSLDYFLTFYRNRPADIEDINNFQARLFFTRNVLLNPFSGVKIFRCSTATDAQLKTYNEQLDAIIKKIIAEKK